MRKHLLVSVGSDADALEGAGFVVRFFESPADLQLTFFHTERDMGLRPPGASGKVVTPVTCALGDKSVKAYDPLERVRKLLCADGFDGEMEAKIFFRQYSKVADVVVEGEEGLYDAIVLNSSELALLGEAYGTGSGGGVLRKGTTAPLWICREVPEGRKDVLLCVDGSAASLRMADHVGYMLAGGTSQRVTMLAVGGESVRVMDALEKATAALLTAGLDENLLDAKIIDGGDVGPTTLALAEEGGYAVVAMGRTGIGLGREPGMFLGSASGYLYSRLRGAALWLCS